MSQEIAELTDSVPWKWWAKYQNFDRQNARVEVVDMLHFVVSLAQVLGMSDSDLRDAYTRKHKVNVQRHEAGYSTKDESDNKTI
jgi:dimeric dUTPase (all-alpha-NTP-PPase superfamily)